MSCERFDALAAELALGIADARERADALRHLTECAACRRALEELSEVADELLLVVPEREPPAGFEARVLARLEAARAAEPAAAPEAALAAAPEPARAVAPRRGWLARHRTKLWAAGSAAVAAAAMALVLTGVYGDDRRLANQYRDTLAQAHGSSFHAARLKARSGAVAGVVFGYRGTPSWLFVDVGRAFRGTPYAAELVLRSGRRVPLPALRVDPVSGSAGRSIPVDLYEVERVRLVGADGPTLEGTFGGG